MSFIRYVFVSSKPSKNCHVYIKPLIEELFEHELIDFLAFHDDKINSIIIETEKKLRISGLCDLNNSLYSIKNHTASFNQLNDARIVAGLPDNRAFNILSYIELVIPTSDVNINISIFLVCLITSVFILYYFTMNIKHVLSKLQQNNKQKWFLQKLRRLTSQFMVSLFGFLPVHSQDTA